MSTVLYRKYRPQTFAEITNQRHIILTLQHEIMMGRVAHAYCFSGPRGVGKTTTARIFARSLNCEQRAQGETEPCNQCGTCQQMTAGSSLDLLEVDAASHTGVDNVRENIIAVSRVVPSGKSKKKIFIIDEVHMLSLSAFNALLKTLEEPPEHVVFILATTELHKVPDTILSRCQRFDFQRIRAEDIVERLRLIARKEGKTVDEVVLRTIALRCDGSVRDAESVFGQVLSLGDVSITQEQAALVLPRSYEKESLALVRFMIQGQLPNALELLQELFEEGMDVTTFFDEVIDVVHDGMRTSGAGDLPRRLRSQAREIALLDLVGKWEHPQWRRALDILLLRRLSLRISPIEVIPLELAVSEIVTPATAVIPIEPSGIVEGMLRQ